MSLILRSASPPSPVTNDSQKKKLKKNAAGVYSGVTVFRFPPGFRPRCGWSEGAWGRGYKMTANKPIETQATIPDHNSFPKQVSSALAFFMPLFFFNQVLQIYLC